MFARGHQGCDFDGREVSELSLKKRLMKGKERLHAFLGGELVVSVLEGWMGSVVPIISDSVMASSEVEVLQDMAERAFRCRRLWILRFGKALGSIERMG